MTGTFHIVVAMKPLEGSFAQNAIKHGVAGLNIDKCRIGVGTGKVETVRYPDIRGDNFNQGKSGYRERSLVVYERKSEGRFPANLILGHSNGCKKAGQKRISSPVRRPTGKPVYNTSGKSVDWNSNKVMDTTVRTHADADGKESVDVWECEEGCPMKSFPTTQQSKGEYVRKTGCKQFLGAMGDGGTNDPDGLMDSGLASRYFKQIGEYDDKRGR